MAADLIADTKQLAEAYGLEFIDCGGGHVQLKGHGNLVNYYPNSKKRTVWSPTLDRRETHCSPWDAVRLCLAEAKSGMKPKKPAKNRADIDLKPLTQNPVGIRHFYNGELPPWDTRLGEFEFLAASDLLRWHAYQLDEIDYGTSDMRSSCR